MATPTVPLNARSEQQPRLSDLTRDPELRRVFQAAERDPGATAADTAHLPPTLTGGAARVLEQGS